ncbi:MAG TPA: hemolysin family protein [Victivallales bacterium]|nr:hemolysin family protein [Victivallales bacterium]
MKELIISGCLVILLSALCSGVEAALLSVSLLKVKKLAQTKNSSALALLSIREKINRPLTTIVIFNNIVNIVGSMFVAQVATIVFGSEWLGLFSGMLTFFIIIFGEIIPKTLGESHCEPISLFIAKPLLILTRLMTPVAWCIEKITVLFTKSQTQFSTDESEIKIMAKIGKKEGAIEPGESDMIQKIFELNDIKASNIMTPRVVMTYVRAKDILEDIKDKIKNSQHSRIAVIRTTTDEVLGIVFKDELLTALIDGKGKQCISDFIHEVQFVSAVTSVDKLLVNFQKTRRHLAFVVDEYGGILGVVTLEDALEVLIGEIVDETDTVVDLQEYARKKRQNPL